MGGIWRGKDFGGLEVLFGHPSGDIVEAIRYMSLKFRAEVMKVLNLSVSRLPI